MAVQEGLQSPDLPPDGRPGQRFVGRVLILARSHAPHHHIGPGVGLFLGGTTDWKLGTMRLWGGVAREKNAYYHVARVNTVRRIRMCQDAGADSFDGTSCTRFAVNTPRLTAAVRQGHLFGGIEG